MKYIDNMTPEERAKFIEEVNELDAMLSALPNPTPHNPTRRKQMKVKTRELTGAALDGVVNQIEECCDDPNTPMFSTSWAQGGPIIEREKIATRYDHDEQEWQATFPDMDGWVYGWGTTPLIAAMRCYVASKLGDDIELPEE